MKYPRIIFSLWCHYILPHLVDSFPKRIPIGAIFDGHASPAVTAMRYEIGKHNNSTAPFKLDVYEAHTDVADSQQFTKTICTTMYKGIFAFYGVTNVSTLDIISSYSRTFHMPYVSVSVPINNSFISSSYTIHMRPSYTHALIDVIRHYKWSHINYIYDNNEGLSRLRAVYNTLYRKNLNIEIQATRIMDTDNSYAMLRQLDARQNDGDKYIVLDMSSEHATTQLLKQILNVGMNRASYHYLLGGLAMDELDLIDFQHGGVNITGFRLVNPEDKKVKEVQRIWSQLSPVFWKGAGTDKIELDVALTMDAVNVIAKALDSMLDNDADIFRGVFRRGQVYNNKTRGIHCFTDIPYPWKHGPGISNALRQVEFTGVTGQIAFDEHGFRKNYDLDVLELSLDNEAKKIGVWSSSSNHLQITKKTDEENGQADVSHRNKTRIITTIQSPPYLMKRTKTEQNGEPLVGNDLYEGYCADLAKEIARLCDFDYIIRPVRDNTYGSMNKNGTWNGMVGELTLKQADIAIAPLTINSQRERVIDFSKPFMRLGISIMIKKPEKQKPGVFSFMDPLSKDIWICIIVAYIGVSVVLFLVSRFSPYEWQIEDSVNGPSFTNDFTLLNSLWFSLGAFMRQGCDVSPRSLSGRIVGSVWWFFTLILISSYTANLAAFLTVERMLTPIESADDLAKQSEIQYGTLASGSTQDFFRNSQVAVYERMWNFMAGQTPSVFCQTTVEGVEKVRNSKGKYAFLLESTMNEYHNQKKPCNTMKVGGNLDSKGYGIATPLKSDLREKINLAVLKLQESGFLTKLMKKWWYDKGECASESDGGGSSQSALTLSNVAGIFYILIGGLGLSMVVSLLEFLYKSKVEARRQKKALANSFRQKARMSARGTPEHENGGVGSRTSFPQYMSAMPITHSSDISLI